MMTNLTPFPTTQSPDEEKLDAFAFPPPSDPSSTSQDGPKKLRRQTAFYPNMNSSNKLQKPFSRSAAKRESVMALGSIEHLQHYFTKTGLAAKQEALKENKGLVPAIGSLTNRPLRPSLSSIQEFHLPPSPAVPVFKRTPYPAVDKTYEVDPENLKPGVIRDLESVSESWGLASHSSESKLDEKFDVLSALRVTTQLIRSVRNYSVSLPDDSIALQPHKQHFRPNSLQPAPTKRVTSNPNGAADPMARIRRSALDVLAVLRVLEETTRLPLSDEAYDAQSDHVSSQDSRSPEPIQAVLEEDEQQYHRRHSPPQQQGQGQGQGQGHDVSFAISVVSVPGRSEAVPVWDDDDSDDLDTPSEAGEKREVWDERLVLGGGWLYRQDVRLTNLAHEREVIGKYLDAVDEALFDGPSNGGTKGWEKAARLELEKEGRAKGRRSSLGRHRDDVSPMRGNRAVSPGMMEAISNMTITEEGETEALTQEPEEEEDDDADSVDEDDLPEWTKRNTFADKPLARAHALLIFLLPTSLLPLLPIPYKDRLELLTALSSGQLLCLAYNSGIRRSRKMWGYINKEAIHDIASLESNLSPNDDGGGGGKEGKTGWTFRRIDNLRLWAAALKLRYLIPLTTPAAALPIPSHASLTASLSPSSPTRPSLSTSTSHPTSFSTPARPISPGSSSMGTGTPSLSPQTAHFPLNANTNTEGNRAKRRRSDIPLIGFDAKLVARREEGWDTMLETVLMQWVNAVVEERRAAR